MDKLKVEILVPSWVKWITVDEDGECRGHKTEPKQGSCGYWTSYDSPKSSVELYKSKPPENWKDELYTWS